MNGLATQKQLHEAIHGDVPHLSAEHHQFANGRASDKLKPFAPEGVPVFDFGTPMDAARRRAARREKLFQRTCKVGIWIVLLLVGASMGYHAKQQREPAPVSAADYRSKTARLPAGRSLHVIDPHEGCLVMMHKDQLGQAIVAHHC